MRDQATELRKLVLRSMQRQTAGDNSAPRLVVVAGGKGGVGTTTMAINLSVAMALNGARVVLADADLNRSDVAPLCGLDDQGAVEDILTARRDIHEVIQRGPAGIQVVPGLWPPGTRHELNEVQQRRLVQQWHSLRRHADIVVLDAGNNANEIVRQFWNAASDVVLTTTPDSVAVMDTYATIKTMSDRNAATPIRLIVNQAASEPEAIDVQRRIEESCRRFLQIHVTPLGHVALDPQVAQAARAGHPLVLHSPGSLAAQQIQDMATALGASGDDLAEHRHERAA